MAPQPSPVRVLVVDDDAMSRDLLGILLEGEGYTVESAESGDAALALLGDGHTAPGIILTDVQMPGISGADLADGLRQTCGPATLLLAMSGSGPDDESISHFDGFLLKPFTMQELAGAVAARGNSTAIRASINSVPLAASTPGTASISGMEGQTSQPRIWAYRS